MRKIYFICIITFMISVGSSAQSPILYEVDSCVRDSLKAGITMYEKLYKKPWTELNLAVVVEERDGEYDFILQTYNNLPPGGLLDLIKNSNRLLFLDENLNVPVILSADRLSKGIRKDHIAFIPLTGYHIKMIYEMGQQKVIYTGRTF